MDFLKSAVASAMAKGPPFPYTFGDKVDLDPSIWTLYNGTRRVWPRESHVLSFYLFGDPADFGRCRKTARTAASSPSTSPLTDPLCPSPRTP